LARAQQGDAASLPGLRRMLRPSSTIWRRYADLGRLAEENLIGLASGTNLALAESLRLALAELKRVLGGETPSPVEKMLVERAAVSWLETSYLDALAGQRPDLAARQAAELGRRRDAAHRRHLSAVQALANVRRLLARPKKAAR
jgi:hypothetical protein